MRVSLDNHNFQVIAADFVPVKPFTAQYLTMAVGQRYDVIITANQTANNYWFRADRASECGSSNAGAGRAIWTYAGVTPATPLSLSIILPLSCAEPGPLVPYWDMQVPNSNFQSTLQTLGVDTTSATVEGTTNIVVWALNTSINIDYSKPTLGYLLNGEGESAIPSRYNALPTANEGDWNYWLIQQVSGAPPIPHPIHLHGHNYFVLGQGSGTYSSSSSLNFQNPTRRDTASVYSGGWLAIAFPSNNPGAWLMHCRKYNHSDCEFSRIICTDIVVYRHRVAHLRGSRHAVPRVARQDRSARQVAVRPAVQQLEQLLRTCLLAEG